MPLAAVVLALVLAVERLVDARVDQHAAGSGGRGQAGGGVDRRAEHVAEASYDGPVGDAGPHRREGVVLVGPPGGQLQRDLDGGGRVGDGEQDLVADRLDDLAAVVDDERGGLLLEASTHCTSAAPSRLRLWVV